jgi:gas vesicle protein
MGKLSTPSPATGSKMDGVSNLKSAALAVQQILLSAQRELGMAKKLRADAQRYLQETEMKARSEAQQILLQTRLATQREVKELIRQANEEIQKALTDIRVIRITAKEELAAQRKFTDAARLHSFTLSLQEEDDEPERKAKKQLASKK